MQLGEQPRIEVGPEASGYVRVQAISAPTEPGAGETACVAWDAAAGVLTVARDRFGARPLFYAVLDRSVAVASSVALLLGRTGMPRALDARAAVSACAGWMEPSASLFLRVRRIPPGHALVVDRGGARLEARRWAGRQRDGVGSALQLREQLARLLAGAVARRVLGRRAACALSGGLDSSALLALLVREQPRAPAFVLADAGPDDPELERARATAARLGARLHVVEASTRDLVERMPDAVLATESLLLNARAVGKHRLREAAQREGVEALLSGAGADELFHGNPGALVRAGAAGTPRPLAELEQDAALVRSLLAPAFASEIEAQHPGAPAWAAWTPRRCREICLRLVLREVTLPAECAPARTPAGFAVHLPYLDDELVALARSVPDAVWLRDATGKAPLRELWRGALDESVRAAPKIPRLASPGAPGSRDRSLWVDLHRSWLSKDRVEDLGVFDAFAVERAIEQHRRMPLDDPRFPALDRVLMRLASASVLCHRREPRAQG
jgi:asparagine synthase (glutamine-hydrolysing)